MTAPFAYLNERLAGLYGVAGVAGADLKKVDLDPKDRAGILTQLAMLLTGDFPSTGERHRPAGARPDNSQSVLLLSDVSAGGSSLAARSHATRLKPAVLRTVDLRPLP
jgi:hypothetical protein